MSFESLFFAVFAVVALGFAWRFLKSGSLTGALLGGRVTREVGVISLSDGSMSSQNLKVNILEASGGDSFVALSLVSKAPLAVSMVPIKLSKPQAQELVQLLQQAISH